MRSVFIIGGTGQIGHAIARRFVADGWDVRIGARRVPETPHLDCKYVVIDRTEPKALAAALGPGADLLVDCVAFSEADSNALLASERGFGRIVAISSASVYCDADGRTLDLARERGFPDYPVPIPEDHPTIAPGMATYSMRKVAMEQTLLDGAKIPVTILRPCAIHGVESKHAREWWFVKRLLDGRRHIPLAFEGQSRFQTTSTEAIAEAAALSMKDGASAIWNVVDGDAPRVREIGETMMSVMGRQADLVLLPDGPTEAGVGQTPWSIARPIVCASSLPAMRRYAETVPAAVRWLEGIGDWKDALPQLAAYGRDHFDYATEDAVFAQLRLA